MASTRTIGQILPTIPLASDSYSCSQGKRLAFDRLVVDKQGNPKKRYMAKASDCNGCPTREQCKGKKAKEK